MKIGNSSINDNTVSVIGKFAVLWNKFERQQFGKNFNSDKLRNKMSSLTRFYDETAVSKLQEVTRQRIIGLFGVYEQGTISRYISEQLGIKVIGGRDSILLKQFIDSYPTQSEEDRLEAALLICHRIRCNMFHGEKDTNATDISSLDAQIYLFKAINSVLELFAQ